MSTQRIRIVVGEEQARLRLDRALALATADYSRTALARFIREGRVAVAGQARKPSYCVRAGEEIVAELPLVELDHIEAEDIPLNIVYEDDDLLVINKPPDLAVHPAGGGRGGTLVNALAHHCRELSDLNGPLRPGIVHRLDRDTSGLIIAAKNNRAHRLLAAQFHDRQVRKEYLAVVRGRPRQLEGEINLPIGRDKRMPRKMAARRLGGRGAISFYRVAEQFRGFTVVEVFPRTGRTHQIRVHMSANGNPVVADAMYGGGDACYPWELEERPPRPEAPIIARQALHARRLAFTHPRGGAEMEFTAPIPADIAALIEALRRARAE